MSTNDTFLAIFLAAGSLCRAALAMTFDVMYAALKPYANGAPA